MDTQLATQKAKRFLACRKPKNHLIQGVTHENNQITRWYELGVNRDVLSTLE